MFFASAIVNAMDREIAKIGFRASLRMDALRWTPVIALSLYAAFCSRYRAVWVSVSFVCSFLAALRLLFSFLVKEATIPPKRSMPEARRFLRRLRIASAMPFTLLITWLYTWWAH